MNISFTNIQCLNLVGDKLWIGTFTKGVDVLDLKTNHCRHYEKDGHPNSILNNDIFAIYTDSRNTTWVSSTTELYTYVPEIDGFKVFMPMNGMFISDILEDKNGNIWFTTYNLGVARYNPDTKEIKRFRHDVKNPNSLCYDRITCAFEDSKKRLWLHPRTVDSAVTMRRMILLRVSLRNKDFPAMWSTRFWKMIISISG